VRVTIEWRRALELEKLALPKVPNHRGQFAALTLHSPIGGRMGERQLLIVCRQAHEQPLGIGPFARASSLRPRLPQPREI
jgi:hypothetical protein